MAGDFIIADVSRYLAELVREAVCPSLLQNREQVALCAPDEESGEAALGIYLYGIEDYSSFVPQRTVSGTTALVGFPAMTLGLNFAVFFNRSTQTPLDELTRQRIFGRIMRTLHNSPEVDIRAIHPEAGAGDEAASISFSRLSQHEKQGLWTGFSVPMRPAVYFQVAPLLLNGAAAEIPRVRAVRGEVGAR